MNEDILLTQENNLMARRKELFHRSLDLVIRVSCMAVFLWAINRYMFGAVEMPGDDMYTAIRDGDVLFYYRLAAPEVQSTVVYESNGELHVGRIAAKGGQRLSVTGDGQLTIDGAYQPVQEDQGIYNLTYISSEVHVNYPFTLNDGEYFILNDDRTRFSDSRSLGVIDKNSIRGRVFTVIRRRLI